MNDDKLMQYIYNTTDDLETMSFKAYQMQNEEWDREFDEYINSRYGKQEIDVKINTKQLKELEQTVLKEIQSVLK